MDYLKKIESSVANFEAETAKLAKIGRLIQNTDKLIGEISNEKEMLKQSATQLENMQAQITKDCETLAEFAKNEESARQKLIADIHEKFMADSRAVIEKLSSPLEQITKNCNTLTEYVEHEESARQKLIADIHEKFMADSRAVIEKLSSPLEQITKNCNTLTEYVEHEESARQKLITDIHEKFMADSRAVIEKLSSPLEQITKNCNALTEYVENEESARQKLITDIHENVMADSRVIIEKLSTPLENSRVQLAESCELLHKLIETHQKSQEVFLANIESLLIKYNTKNLEVYNNITGTLSNKIDVARDNIETNLNLKLNNCVQEISNLDNKIEKNIQVLQTEINGVAEELKTTLQEMLSTIQYIKTAVSIAVGTGVIACIISFLK